MNRTQLLSVILGLLVILAGALFTKGYFMTWEDYRPLLVEETNDECIADLVIAVGEKLQCTPKWDPMGNLERCLQDIEETPLGTEIEANFLIGIMVCTVGDILKVIPDSEEDSENNINI